MGTAPKTPKPPDLPAVKVAIGDMVLDRYRVVEQIASGGHSVVFRGTDERLSRPVCIKVFSGLGGKSGVGRTSYEHFVQEAFALSRLTHPNTLRIYDFGHLGTKDAEGMPLQVCEFMNGGTLSHVVREQGKQSLAETSRVIGAMCAALGESHALGIVHRDIKPQNILFNAVGGNKLPKLADFGIAKWSVDDTGPSEAGKRAEDTAIVAGQKLAMYSPSWAAPEQLAGQPVSAATDIYSLAVVAVYMMSGRAIFADEDVYAGYKKRRHADEHVREALEPFKVPRAVITLLVKALEFDPKRRLAKVEELATGLAAGVAGEEMRTPSPPAEPTAPLAALFPLTPTIPNQAITPPAGTPNVAEPEPPKSAGPTTGPTTGSMEPLSRPSPTPAPASTPQQHWQPQPVRSPWMTATGAAVRSAGSPHTLQLAEGPQPIGDRTVHFVHATTGVADMASGQNKLRVTFLTGPTGARVLHLKGMSCFVAHLGGRPSPAVQIDQPGDIALVTPRAQEIGHVRVATGNPSGNVVVFPIGSELAAVSSEDCTDAILFDFGPGSDAYFVYTRGRAIPKLRRR